MTVEFRYDGYHMACIDDFLLGWDRLTQSQVVKVAQTSSDIVQNQEENQIVIKPYPIVTLDSSFRRRIQTLQPLTRPCILDRYITTLLSTMTTRFVYSCIQQ
jgi:hypothetical protein